MGGSSSFPYESVRREVYRANGLDAAETAAALALENSLTTVDEQVNDVPRIFFIKYSLYPHFKLRPFCLPLPQITFI